MTIFTINIFQFAHKKMQSTTHFGKISLAHEKYVFFFQFISRNGKRTKKFVGVSESLKIGVRAILILHLSAG